MNLHNGLEQFCKRVVRSRCPQARIYDDRQAGFSLMELMIVVAIIAVLVAFAYPAYQQYTIKTNRKAAEACLSEQANYMERYYTTNLTYAPVAGAPAGTVTYPTLDCASQNRTGANYTYTFPVSASTTAYLIQAAPASPLQSKDTCGTLQLDQTGKRYAIGGTSTVQQCW